MAPPVKIDSANEGLKNLDTLVATLPQKIPDGGKKIPIVLGEQRTLSYLNPY
jgi:hypothetical protein